MGTDLSFKKGILLVSLFFNLVSLKAQMGKKEMDDNVLVEFGISYMLPKAYGDNFLSQGYDIRNGINVDGRILVAPKWFVGAQWSQFKGDVIDMEKVGAIEKSGITHIYAVATYTILGNDKQVSVRTGFGAGYVLYRHKQSTTKFMDDGFSVAANLALCYRFSNSLGVFVKLEHYWDFLNIDTAPELETFFRNAQIFAPSIGIKVYTF
ncbi:hypothetical protein [Flagellimonas amoyensis]|uniref:hypothetical protein n=1 Tax=Flagellimonas amoyensis TaxID=2169401 RepID=UPI000D3A1E96|nr:hypothetical protein [Allomuricauda amoyensis]